MKHMKSIIRFAALLLMMVCAQTVKAQMYIMVHKNDGNVLKIAVSDVDSVTFKEWTGPIFSYEYVDLGLSVQWATCNVGANSPEYLMAILHLNHHPFLFLAKSLPTIHHTLA